MRPMSDSDTALEKVGREGVSHREGSSPNGRVWPAHVSLATLIGLMTTSPWTGVGAGIGAVMGVVALALYAIADPRVSKLAALSFKLEREVAQAERATAEVRDTAASLTRTVLETFARLGRMGGPSHDDLRSAGEAAAVHLRAMGCSHADTEQAVQPIWSWIRRDAGLIPIQREYAAVAKEKGMDLGNAVDDRRVADRGKAWRDLRKTDPSPEVLQHRVQSDDELLGIDASKDKRVVDALAQHRSLWNERPPPRLQSEDEVDQADARLRDASPPRS